MTARLLRRALAPALALCALAPAADAAVELRHTYAGPITPESRCTAEPRNAIYANATFDPTLRTIPINPTNLASSQDLVPALEAGATSDFCIGFALTPDFSMARPIYGSSPSNPVDPATDPVTGDDLRDVVITLPPGYEAQLKNVPTCSLADFGPSLGTVLQFSTEDPFSIDPPEGVGRAVCDPETQLGDALVRASTVLPVEVQAIMGNGQAGSSQTCATSACLTKTAWVYNLERVRTSSGASVFSFNIPHRRRTSRSRCRCRSRWLPTTPAVFRPS